MAEQIYPHALTTVQRIKDRLTITGATLDSTLLRLINSVTDYVEGETNRRFLREAVSNEVHSVHSPNTGILIVDRLPIVSIASIEYAVGVGSGKSWTPFSDTIYEKLESGKSGMVKIYGGMPSGVNQVRISYTGGYLIDFTSFGDTTLHNLPADITDLCERLVTKYLKRREAEGKTSEAINQATLTWARDLDAIDRDIINRYRRLPQFV